MLPAISDFIENELKFSKTIIFCSSAQPYMTVIEPDVLLGSDFWSFASAMASLLDTDSTIGSISGFNPDGTQLLAKNPSQAYR